MLILSFLSELNNTITWGESAGTSPITFFQLLANVQKFLEAIVASVALVALVWAGLTYIVSLGDEARSARAKRTAGYAILGLIVAASIWIIREIVVAILSGSTSFAENEGRVVAGFIRLFLQILLAPAGVVAFGALVYGGYMYITSGGDESRAERGKRVILYALLGLIVIGLSGIVVNIVIANLP